MILNLVSGPRNVSTALMYSFAQRNDTIVLDEPFYAVFLANTGIEHPAAEEVLRSQPQNEAVVKAHIASLQSKPVLFLKNMAHHMEVLREPLIPESINIFLIRDPAQILASYSEVIAHPIMRDIGIAYQYALFRRLEDQGSQPIVIDSGFLLDHPVPVLIKLCRHCGLAFEQRMAHWPPGPKPYDGVWASYWYANVHRSTGFEKQRSRNRPVPAHLNTLYSEARSFYEKLLPFALKA